MADPAPPVFAERGDHTAIEEGLALAPKFDADGLIVAVVSDADTGDVLMVAHMDAHALARTIETRQAWFWSRSRKAYWRKGEESGNTLEVTEMRIDCDQDVVLVRARIAGNGVACHQGYRSCFYRAIPLGRTPDPATELVLDTGMPRVLPR